MTNVTMNKRQKKGISTVLTTLIIVVASVVLGTAVTLFGTSLFQTGAQQQGMSVSNSHLWFQSNATLPQVEGAFVARNTGDKIIAIDTIQVRGLLTNFDDWEGSTTITPTSSQMTAQYRWTAAIGTPAAGTTTVRTVDAAGTTVSLTVQSGPISLDPGKSVIVFFAMPATQTGITSADIGGSATLNIKAGQINSVQTVTVAKA